MPSLNAANNNDNNTTPTKTLGVGSSAPASRMQLQQQRPTSARSPSGLTPNPKRQSTEFLSPGTMESPQQIQSIVSDLRRRNDQLSKLLDTYKDREDEIRREMDELKANHRKQLMKWESTAMDREQELHQTYKRNLQQLEYDLSEAQKQSEEGKAAIKELQMARDEIEVYQHNRAILSETTEKLRKYKEKVAELQDVREALQREQEAHAQSVDEVVKLENELQSLQGVKRQLEDYKIRAIEAEVKLVETQDCLRRLEQKSSDQTAANEYLWKGAVMQKEQMEELRRRIQEETQAAMDRSNGLGASVSEFNPEIMEELVRLRNENLHLRSFASKRENDAVEKLESDLDDAKRLGERYKNEYLNTKAKLEETQMELEESQRRTENLTVEVDAWKQRWEETDRQRRGLEAQLDETQNTLDETSQMLKESERRCERLHINVEELTKRAHEAEKESTKRFEMWQRAQRECETTSAELEAAGMQVQEIGESMRVWERRAREMEDARAKLEQELEESQENLMSVRIKLGDFERRNQDLHLKIEQLKEEKKELSDAVTREKQSKSDLMEECHRSLEATREVLMAKSKKEIEELQGNMNCLLDDERRASRRKDEEYQRKVEQLESKWKRDYEELQERLTSSLKSSRQEAQDRIDFIKSEYEKELEKTRKDAAEAHDNLITKGKGMLDDMKQKTTEELKQMDDYCNSLQEKINNLLKDKVETENKLRSEVNVLTQQRDYSTEEYNGLSQQYDDLQETVRRIEREKLKLQEDNDRFRRQLGGRYGADGKSQAQLEKLQLEYNAILEENRNLKNQIRMAGRSGLGGIAESEEENAYGRSGGASRSTFSQIRHEYEEKIDKLNDEKRELIMKQSAAATDVQKAEQRVWERDQEIAKLKAELTSMQLKQKRADYNREFSSEYGRNDTLDNLNSTPRDMSFLTANENMHSPHQESEEKQKLYNGAFESASRPSPSLDRAFSKKTEEESSSRGRISSLATTSRAPPRSFAMSPLKDLYEDFDAGRRNGRDPSPTRKHELSSNQLHERSDRARTPVSDVFGLGTTSAQSAKGAYSTNQQKQASFIDFMTVDEAAANKVDGKPECKQS